MRTMFDARKTAQAASFLVQLNGGTMNYMVLVKLLYLADRRALIETGAPITGDRMVAMPHGPVLSQTLDQINLGKRSETDQAAAWYECLTEPSDYNVSMKKKPEVDQLSHYETDVLRETYETFGKMDIWDLVDHTHRLPEWIDPNGSSFPIDPETILRASGRSEEEIREIVERAEQLWFIRSLAAIA